MDHEAFKALVKDMRAAQKELHYKHLTDYDCEIVSIKKSAIVDILRG